LGKFRDISSDVWTLNKDSEHDAYTLAIDKIKLESELRKEGYKCQTYRDHI
jgi:hypothetical protein